jgi:hypothetical protein
MLDARGGARVHRTGNAAKNRQQMPDHLGSVTAGVPERVTAGRSRPVGAPTPRSLSTGSRRRRGLPPDVKTATPDALILHAASAAADSVEPIIDVAVQVANEFRRRELGRAQANLSDLFRTLRTLTLITSRLADHALPESAGNAGALYDDLMRTLDEFAKQQQAEDWDAVARLLTHDLRGILAEWPATLRALATRARPGEPIVRSVAMSVRAEVRS